MTRARVSASHVEWLSLVETTGTFLSVPTVRRVFPQGLPQVPAERRAEVRRWLTDEPVSDQASATAWLEFVLQEVLQLDSRVLLQGPAVPERATHLVPEHGLLRPDYVVADLDDGNGARPLRMGVMQFPYGTRPDKPIRDQRWAASPLERAQSLVRGTKLPLALATDGDWYAVAATPPGGSATSATWSSQLFGEEPVLLDSFVALLSAQRFFAVDRPNTLAAMIEESVQAQEDVTNQLGDQVRRAVELLVAAISRANRARGGALLDRVTADEIYEAALTCMMRLVFLLYAEERDLLPSRLELYASSYGVSGLRQTLRVEADRHGEEALERRASAWSRLLATFRVVFAGVDHEAMRLPAYGGRLFDPDRYPFLEGRADGEPWRAHKASPLPIDDRTVLAIMEALQVLTFRDSGVVEARPLSYRSLDVEQIGHVYEGLIDHGAVWVTDLSVGLRGKTSDGPEVALSVVEEAASLGRSKLVETLTGLTGLTKKRIERDLDHEPDPDEVGRLRSACEFDEDAFSRLLPYLGLMEDDLRGLPMVFMPGSVYVTQTTERRDTGTQYTPKELADEIVRRALDPLVYDPGPAQGAVRSEWRIRRPEAILGLRVCDPAVGSGAILVAACRYLSERLMEAVSAHSAEPSADIPMDAGDIDAYLTAQRLVVDRCLFGVDRDAMAAEMAKLSLWLVTMARERPFSFLDHSIRVGDSLLGITSLEQVRALHTDSDRGKRLHQNLLDIENSVGPLVEEAREWIRAMDRVVPVTVSDIEEQRAMSTEADRVLERVHIVADAVVGKAFAAAASKSPSLDTQLKQLAAELSKALDHSRSEVERSALWAAIRDQALYELDADRPLGSPPRRPLHWPLAFPEVFDAPRYGFDAVVGNPPFQGGKRISGANGRPYREFLVNTVAAGRKGNSDLVAYFFLKATQIASPVGRVGFFATNTISQGDTREVGLDHLVSSGWRIVRATKTQQWPGKANVAISQVWLARDDAQDEAVLDGQPVVGISSLLEPSDAQSLVPSRLAATKKGAFKGSNLNGIGFVLSDEEAQRLLDLDPNNADVVKRYINGQDLNTQADQLGTRWVVCFYDWPIERAAQYGDCLDLVRERVKPQRDSLPDYKRRVRERWWQFEYVGMGLFERLEGLQRVLATAVVSKPAIPVAAPASQVFSQDVVVFPGKNPAALGVLSSALHWWWTVRYASTMRSDIRYAPTDLFQTFPQPTPSDALAAAAHELDEYRRGVMSDRGEGLTTTYNRVNDPREHGSDVVTLRQLHIALDEAAASAYDWEDIALDHGFETTPIGIRYTVSPAAQREILQRLLELNREMHAAEQSTDEAVGTRHRKPTSAPEQLSLSRGD